jgi:hypothetical protein
MLVHPQAETWNGVFAQPPAGRLMPVSYRGATPTRTMLEFQYTSKPSSATRDVNHVQSSNFQFPGRNGSSAIVVPGCRPLAMAVSRKQPFFRNRTTFQFVGGALAVRGRLRIDYNAETK